MEGYLRVKNWGRFQHYAKRRPPWIKLYNDLIGNGDEFEHLDEFEQWQLVRIWLLASRSSKFTVDEEGKEVPVIVADEKSLRRSIQTLKRIPLAKLVKEGWLLPVRASALLAEGAESEPDYVPDASALLEPENQKEPKAVTAQRDVDVALLVADSLGLVKDFA